MAVADKFYNSLFIIISLSSLVSQTSLMKLKGLNGALPLMSEDSNMNSIEVEGSNGAGIDLEGLLHQKVSSLNDKVISLDNRHFSVQNIKSNFRKNKINRKFLDDIDADDEKRIKDNLIKKADEVFEKENNENISESEIKEKDTLITSLNIIKSSAFEAKDNFPSKITEEIKHNKTNVEDEEAKFSKFLEEFNNKKESNIENIKITDSVPNYMLANVIINTPPHLSNFDDEKKQVNMIEVNSSSISDPNTIKEEDNLNKIRETIILNSINEVQKVLPIPDDEEQKEIKETEHQMINQILFEDYKKLNDLKSEEYLDNLLSLMKN